jgi:preprotein translocase subunit SecA
MKQLGLKEDEMIEHSMVSSAMKRAQAKIGKKITIEKRARSQQEWFDNNYKK